jgi:hypothetical protein
LDRIETSVKLLLLAVVSFGDPSSRFWFVANFSDIHWINFAMILATILLDIVVNEHATFRVMQRERGFNAAMRHPDRSQIDLMNHNRYGSKTTSGIVM